MRATFIIGINHKHEIDLAERLLVVCKSLVSATNHCHVCLPTKRLEDGDRLRKSPTHILAHIFLQRNTLMWTRQVGLARGISRGSVKEMLGPRPVATYLEYIMT